MQSLWCCQKILSESVAQVHVYLPEGTLALSEDTKVHIDVLPLGVLLVRQFLEVGKELAFQKVLKIKQYRKSRLYVWLVIVSYG